MIKKIRAGVRLLFFLLLSFEACKAGDAEKEAAQKAGKKLRMPQRMKSR